MTVPLRNRYLDPATHYVAEWTTTERLAQRTDAWRTLFENSIEPNPFYAPEYLLASAQLDKRDIRCVAIYRDGSRDSELVGLFPLQRARILDGFLVPALEFYFNDYTCRTTPLIHKDDPQGVWDCFLDRCLHTLDQPQKIISRLMPTAGAIHAALQAALAERGLAVAAFDVHQRAAVERPDRFLTAFAKIASARRSDMRRRRRRMRLDGHGEISTLKGSQITPDIIDAFLNLEASGWKGKAGTALGSREDTRAFARAAFASPNTELNVLTFNGQIIAADVCLNGGGVLYPVKTAYDESFSGYSPGMLLAIHMMRLIADGPGYTSADSCSIAGHIVETIWPDRLEIGAVTFATSTAVSRQSLDQMIGLIGNIRRLRRWVSQTLRSGKAA